MSAPVLNPPFRAEHLGSLKRPAELLKKRAEFEKGECTLEELREVEDRAIRSIIQVQREAGIKAITDGEFRRYVVDTAFMSQFVADEFRVA